MEENVIEINPVYNVVLNVLGEPKKHNRIRHQLQYNCPICDEGNNKGNLEINYAKLVMKCWKCCDLSDGLSGSLRKLIKQFGTHLDVKLYDNLTDGITYSTISGETKTIIQSIELPKEFTTFLKGNPSDITYKEAFNYLKDRGIDLQTIIKYNIGYCPTGTYKGRIIIPSYDKNGKLNYFVGRSFVGHKQKYKNPQIPKEDIIANEMNINWDSTIYLVEGMFDMIGIGIRNTIPLLGKVLHNKLYSTILEKANGNVVILLDPDARKQAIQMYHKLNGGRLMGRIRFIDLPDGMDISDVNKNGGREEVIKVLYQNRELTLQDIINN